MTRKTLKVIVANKGFIWYICYIIHPFGALYMFAFVRTWLGVSASFCSVAFIVSILENINLDKTCIAAWLVDLFPHRLYVHFLWNGSKICFGMWTPEVLAAKWTNKNSFYFGFSWIRCMNIVECFSWHILLLSSPHMLLLFLNFLGRYFFMFCRRELRQRKSFTQRRQKKKQRRCLRKQLLLVCLMLRTPQWRHKVLK